MTPPPSLSFDYKQGSAFVYEGYLYYSPNCSRSVVIQPPPASNVDPFKKSRLDPSDYRQPVWWTDSWGWMALIPLAPTFVSYPFEPFNWMPKIVSISVPAKSSQHYQTKFQMADDDAALWIAKEKLIVDAALRLRTLHGITASPPPLPSSFGFHKPHKTRALVKCMINLARNWFGVWMGHLSYIIRRTSVSIYKQPDNNSPHPYWYHPLIRDGRWSLPWLDGIASSPVGDFDNSIARSGIVIPWAEEDRHRPPIDFFVGCAIPLFFPWTSAAEKAISKDSSLEYLRPPKELIQQALTFILSAPNNTPLASMIMQRYCGLATEIRDPTSVRALRLHNSTSEVVSLVTERFLAQYDMLSSYKDKAEADEAIKAATERHHRTQIGKAAEAAEEASSLSLPPQQGILPVEKGQSPLFADWRVFFRRRNGRLADILNDASPRDIQSYQSRKAHPPRKNTQVFVWEVANTAGELDVYLRKRIEKREFDDIFEEDNPAIYNEIHNEWDIFPDFVWDKDGISEDGVPSICRAQVQQYVPYGFDGGDDDSDDEFELPVNVRPNVNSITSSVESVSFPITSTSADVHRTIDYTSADVGQAKEYEDISFSTPLFRALEYNYGYTRAVNMASIVHHPSLDWRGVGKALGFMSVPPPGDEDLSIRAFVSCLADKTSLPADMDDLHEDNFTSLRSLFDFRNILRPAKNLFIFHRFSSTNNSSCKWLLAVRSPVAVLYVVRYIVLNKTRSLNTVTHRLLKYGIPFQTLLLRRTSCQSLTIPATTRYRYSNHVWVQADYESAILACKARLQGPVGRAALLRGGLIGRIAREFISVDAVFDGPSSDVIHYMSGLVFDSEAVDYQYWDDILTESNIDVICGCFTMYTGRPNQTTLLSYFPRPSEWDTRSGFSWLEWTSASENLFQRILKRNKAGEPPLNPAKWHKELRGFGSTRKLLDFNSARSSTFVDAVCPIRDRR